MMVLKAVQVNLYGIFQQAEVQMAVTVTFGDI